jgi:hypothetical protein
MDAWNVGARTRGLSPRDVGFQSGGKPGPRLTIKSSGNHFSAGKPIISATARMLADKEEKEANCSCQVIGRFPPGLALRRQLLTKLPLAQAFP